MTGLIRRFIVLIGQFHLTALIGRGADIPGRPLDGGQATDDGDDRAVLTDRLARSREVPGIVVGAGSTLFRPG